MKSDLSRICVTATVACVLCVAAPALASTNLLANTSFEDNGGSYDGWFTFGSGPQISTPLTDNIARSGTAAAKIFGEFSFCPTPVFDVGGFGQAFTPTVGKVYSLGGYSFVSSADAIPGSDTCNNNRLIAQVAFFDAASAGTVIASNEVVIGDFDTPLDQWIPFSVSAPAPPGALRVEALFLFLQPGCDTGSVYVDDAWFYESPSPVEPNVLANPSFDTDLSGWSTFGNVFYDGRNFARRTPTGGAKLFGTFVMNSDTGMFQTFAAAPGQTWQLSGYSLTTCVEDPISGTNDNMGILRIVFRDGIGTDIGGDDVVVVDNTAPLGTWNKHMVEAVAPTGTASVDAFVLFVQPSLLGGAMWVDDLVFAQKTATGIPDYSDQAAFRLYQNSPNPFNPTTRIAFELDQADLVNITIYDVTGRQITTLVNREYGVGTHSVTWDGRSTVGEVAPSGVYFYRLTTSTGQQTRRMVLMK